MDRAMNVFFVMFFCDVIEAWDGKTWLALTARLRQN